MTDIYHQFFGHQWLVRPLTIDETRISIREYLAAREKWHQHVRDGFIFEEPPGPVLSAQAHLALLDLVTSLQDRVDRLERNNARY